MTRQQRVQAALIALQTVDENLVRDLLANLMHYCRATKQDFDHELRLGHAHFEAEIRERGKRGTVPVDYKAVCNQIFNQLNGEEWDSDTTSAIAEIITEAGYKIVDPNVEEAE